MININALPCIGCKHFGGVKQPGKVESAEYASCNIASDKKVESVAEIRGKSFYCNKREEEYAN